MWRVLRRAAELGVMPVVPADVVVEWWRGRTDIREHILASVCVEPLDESLARLAGEAMAAIPGATSVDAIVMASAAGAHGRVDPRSPPLAQPRGGRECGALGAQNFFPRTLPSRLRAGGY